MIVLQESKSRHAGQTLSAARTQDGEMETVYIQVDQLYTPMCTVASSNSSSFICASILLYRIEIL